jgi:hypothetical protein
MAVALFQSVAGIPLCSEGGIGPPSGWLNENLNRSDHFLLNMQDAYVFLPRSSWQYEQDLTFQDSLDLLFRKLVNSRSKELASALKVSNL